MNKKIIRETIISILLLAVVAAIPLTAKAQVLIGGNCCPYAGPATNCQVGLTCSGAVPNDNDPPNGCDTSGKCVKAGLKDCCVLRRDINFGGGLNCLKDQYAPRTAEAKCGEGISPCQAATQDNWGMFCLFNTIYRVTDWIFYIVMPVVVLMIILGGVYIMTAAGDPNRTGTGKKLIIYAIVGLAISLIARAVPWITKTVMGM